MTTIILSAVSGPDRANQWRRMHEHLFFKGVQERTIIEVDLKWGYNPPINSSVLTYL